MAEWTPALRAGYEQDEITPRPSALPLTANAFPARDGFSTPQPRKKMRRGPGGEFFV